MSTGPVAAVISKPLVNKPDMSLDLALVLLAGVREQCSTRGIALAAAVVDRGGNLVSSARMDGAQLGALSIATDKAFTAAAFGHPTSAWTASSAPGGGDWGLAHALGGRAIVFPGGVPIFDGGELIGALGVSGAASTVDEECALAAAAAAGVEAAAA
ncbi:GlcG/HbpS family heme-binding protein [Ruicaihuangia caeni]|uniref:GlcG/HbpS family heme-binding protein n=1 Tax=Ruicaihuangia caeni TaxID=3042517 RepID=UPI00338F05F0